MMGSFGSAGDGGSSGDDGDGSEGGGLGPARSRRNGGWGRWTLSFARAEQLTAHCVRVFDPVAWGFCSPPVSPAVALCTRNLQSVVDEARAHADIQGGPPAMALALILNGPPPALHRDCMLTSTGLPESSFTDFETFIVRVLGCLVAVVEASRDVRRLGRLQQQLVEVQRGGLQGVFDEVRRADSQQLASFWPADATAAPCGWVFLRCTMGYGDFTTRHAARQLIACGVGPEVFNAPAGFVFNHRGRLVRSRPAATAVLASHSVPSAAASRELLQCRGGDVGLHRSDVPPDPTAGRRASRWGPSDPQAPLDGGSGRRPSRWAPSNPVADNPRPGRRKSRWAPSNPAAQQA